MLQTATAAVDWYILAPVVIPLLTAAVLIIFRRAVGLHPYMTLLALAGNIYASFELLMKVKLEGPLAMTMGNWLPPFGISFTADFLGAVLTLTSSLAVFCVALYGMGDASSRERRFGFYPLILTLLVGVNGSFLTGDIFNLYATKLIDMPAARAKGPRGLACRAEPRTIGKTGRTHGLISVKSPARYPRNNSMALHRKNGGLLSSDESVIAVTSAPEMFHSPRCVGGCDGTEISGGHAPWTAGPHPQIMRFACPAKSARQRSQRPR